MDTTLIPQDVRYWLALHYAPAIGPGQFHQLLAHFPNPQALFEADALSHPATAALSSKTRKYLKSPDWDRVDKDLRWAEDNHCHILSFIDPRYPDLLKEITDAPPLLFVRGNPDRLNTPQLAMVGSRNPSPGGSQNAKDFARSLSQIGLGITSGLALGIDACSHRSALDGGGTTIAVAGTGPDRIYPARHRALGHEIIEHGAIVTEFSPGMPPLAANFPRRNRIISGLSLGTLVVEAALQSGSLITARLAAEQGREVFAIPGSIHNPMSRGCHALIRQGAKLTENISHILEELGPLVGVTQAQAASTAKPERDEPHTDSAEAHFIAQNMGFEPVDIDTLVRRSGLTADKVSAMLVSLELQGRVISTGGLYCRTDISR